MNKVFTLIFSVLSFGILAQSYAPPANVSGTTAIHKDSSAIVAWATHIDLSRGYLDIQDTNFVINGSNKASFGNETNALYYAEGNQTSVVSLGDSGVATLGFDWPIFDGPGPDFAVFENSFDHQYLELAFVEVSSDGMNFVRFPNHSETQTLTQISGFGYLQAERLHNLAGKYKSSYGTPFDLSELSDSLSLDINNVRFVRVVDVVGSIGEKANFDSQGNKVNDPYPTNYETGGFDLDGVGVMHQIVGMEKNDVSKINAFPNPATDYINFQSENVIEEITIVNSIGAVVKRIKVNSNNYQISLNEFDSGLYFALVDEVKLKFILSRN